MLSRLALRNAQILPAAARAVQVAPTSTTSVPDWKKLPRPVRLIDPSPVRFGIIPDSWFRFFYPKTGITGPYAFFYGVATYLVSKEIYVVEHEFYSGLSLLILIWGGKKLFGDTITNYLEKEQQKEVDMWEGGKLNEIENQKAAIEAEKLNQFQCEAQSMVFEAKKENVRMQLETVYRERVMQVYKEVKNRLDYHAQIQNIERRIAHRHMSQWIINNVLKAITPEQEKATLQQCIKDLEALAARA